MNKSPYRAVVTGGAGFIGSNLVDRLLAEGHSVDVVDDLSSGSLANLAEARALGAGRFHFHQVDVRSPDVAEVIARRRPQVVFHLAAQTDVPGSVNGPVLDAEVNIVGGLRILEGARRAGARKVVFASSGGAIYGPTDQLPIKELQPQQPLSPYGVAKKAFTDYLFAYRELHGLEFTALALANVYGARQSPTARGGVVASFTVRLLAGEPCVVYGDGRETRDFVYIDDVVDAFSRAGERGSGLLCNIGTGTETSISTLYSVLAAHLGVRASPLHAPARPGELSRNCLDPSRAALHLGWRPWTTLELGIAAAAAWYQERS